MRDVSLLHNESLFAVAQKKYTYIYDTQGTEVRGATRAGSTLMPRTKERVDHMGTMMWGSGVEWWRGQDWRAAGC